MKRVHFVTMLAAACLWVGLFARGVDGAESVTITIQTEPTTNPPTIKRGWPGQVRAQ